MDPLIELPLEKWPLLRELYEPMWPESAVAYCMLDSMIKYPNLKQDFEIKIYCPEGVMEYGMIATSLQGDFYQVIIQPIDSDIIKIEEALLDTEKIDWNQPLCVPSASDKVIKCLEKLKLKLGIKVHYDEVSRAYKHLLNQDAKKFDITLPENSFMGPLTEEHIDLIDRTWTYYNQNSRFFFEALMKSGLTYVLYSSEGKPMAWMSVDNFGALTHLFTLEEYRGKGYAEVVAKYAVNDLLDKGQNVLAYTLEGNVKPKKLFKKMGFVDFGFDHWVFVSKIDETTS